LVNPKLFLDLPASPGPDHNGVALTIGPDKQSVYLVVGDVKHKTKTVNNNTGVEPDGTSGILHLTLDGKPVNGSILDVNRFTNSTQLPTLFNRNVQIRASLN
jgi:aldose sugar dehydrogenase